MLVYASVCAVLLLAGLGEARKQRPRAYKTINELTVTNAYSGWGNSPDACFQLKLVPAFISKENRRAAGKAIRNAGKRHAWIYAVRYDGKWVSKRLKLQLPASARKLSNRDLKEGEKGEVVEETNPDVVHVTLCEKPGSHRRLGYRRHHRGRRHRRHHRHHHDRRRNRSRDRGSYSLDRKSSDDDRSSSLQSDSSRRYRSDDSSRRYRSGRDRRGNGLRRTGGGFLDSRSSDTDKDNRNNRHRDRSEDSKRSYDRRDRRRNRDRSVSSDRHRRRHSSYSDDRKSSSKSSSSSSSSSDNRRRRHHHRHSSKRSEKRSHRDDSHSAHADGTCPYTGKSSPNSLEALLNKGSPNFLQ